MTVRWSVTSYLYEVGHDHPVFHVARPDIPQPGAYAHFHWLGMLQFGRPSSVNKEKIMELALVVAIIRSDKLAAAERALHAIGVSGITVIKARGFGEQSISHDVLGRALMQDQVKLEIYVASEQAERVAHTVIGAARGGSSGDGIVAILPVHRVFSVHTESDTIPNRSCSASQL